MNFYVLVWWFFDFNLCKDFELLSCIGGSLIIIMWVFLLWIISGFMIDLNENDCSVDFYKILLGVVCYWRF